MTTVTGSHETTTPTATPETVFSPGEEEIKRLAQQHAERTVFMRFATRARAIGRSAIGLFSPKIAAHPAETDEFAYYEGATYRIGDERLSSPSDEKRIATLTAPSRGDRGQIAETDSTFHPAEKRWYQKKLKKEDRGKRGKIAAFRRHKKVGKAERFEAIAHNELLDRRLEEAIEASLIEDYGVDAWNNLADDVKEGFVRLRQFSHGISREDYKPVPTKREVRVAARHERDYPAFLLARFTPRIYTKHNRTNGLIVKSRERYAAALRQQIIGHALWEVTPHDKDESYVDYVRVNEEPDPRAIASGQKKDNWGKPMVDSLGRPIYNDDWRGFDNPSSVDKQKAILIGQIRSDLRGMTEPRIEYEIARQLGIVEAQVAHVLDEEAVVDRVERYAMEQADIAANAELGRQWLREHPEYYEKENKDRLTKTVEQAVRNVLREFAEKGLTKEGEEAKDDTPTTGDKSGGKRARRGERAGSKEKSTRAGSAPDETETHLSPREEQERFEEAKIKLEEVLPDIDNLTAEIRDTSTTEERYIDILARLRQYADDLHEAGIDIVVPEEGTPFDPNMHEIIEIITPYGIGDSYVIAETLRLGFVWENKTLRPSWVNVIPG